MAKVLKNLKVTEVSILTGDKLPANGESVIIKDADSFEIVAKADKCIDGLVYCTVMKANTPDSDGEESDPETIKKAAHDFLTNSRTIDENHNHSALDGVHVVESYIDDKGDWKAVFDVADNALMLEKAMKGEITGVSIYGKAQKVEKAGKEFNFENESFLRQFYNWAKSKFEKTPETNIIKSEETEMPITKDEFEAMAKECGYAPVAKVPEVPAVNEEVETLKSTVKTLTETVAKQAKDLEEIAKNRTTETETKPGEITLDAIMKCADPAKAEEMYKEYQKTK
jgi:hypothetical protein